MKINNPKKIVLYFLITFIGLIIVGLVGAIIRLINIPAIIITIILIVSLGYYKKIEWLKKIITDKLSDKDLKYSKDLLLKNKKQAAGKSLRSIENLITLINDDVTARALKEEKNRVSLELERGDIILVVFGIGSSGKTSLIRALLKRIVGEVSP